MGVLTILHLSDFHWNCSNARNMKIVVGALCEDLRRLRNDEQLIPDLAIFSGDLVQAGEEPTTFAAAYDALLVPMLEAAGLTAERLFMVAGNHDIARSVVRENKILEQGLRSELTGGDAVNAFIDALPQRKEVNQLALARLANFEEFIRSVDGKASRTLSPLLRTYVAEISGRKIGIACFNTAWRATGEPDAVDRHLLLLGERNVDIAIADLSEVDLRLAIFHHPMDWLAEFDEVAVASRLYSSFDILFFGHTHRGFPEARTTPIGSSILSQAGCLYQTRDYFNGYQILRIDPVAGNAEFLIRTYNDNPRRGFDKALNIAADGRLSIPFVSRSSTPSLNV
jgi:predicted phosphodiesterase